MIRKTEAFLAAWPAARVGCLAMSGVENPAEHAGLEGRKRELEESLRRCYEGWDRQRMKEIPVVAAYRAWYRRFGQSYHLVAQLESVALGGKPLPRVAALVEAMFMAELSSLILTAGHDLAALVRPLVLDTASGGESYTGMNGKTATCTRGDMVISDAEGVISSVLSGPDARTRITTRTTSVLFVAYAPEGVGDEALRAHLDGIERLVRTISPVAQTIESVIV